MAEGGQIPPFPENPVQQQEDPEDAIQIDLRAHYKEIDKLGDCMVSEETVPDDPSDSEDFNPQSDSSGTSSDPDSSDSDSSGDEEEGISVHHNEQGGVAFYRLKFADVEAKRKEHEAGMTAMDQSADDIDPGVEELEKDAEGGQGDEQLHGIRDFKYRTETILDNDLEKNYESDEDNDFDPIYCGETLSDIEYGENDERDTESEPETEEVHGKHRKTGENLVCIKMMENLKIPPMEESLSFDNSVDNDGTENLMDS